MSGMKRREFLMAGAAAMAPVPRSILVHEHVLVDFAGAASTAKYDAEEVFRIAKPKLEELKSHGCRRVLECTPNFLGRNARLLKRLEDATGIELWTNTGIYGAAKRSGVPAFAYQETAEQLAARWVEEWKKGVDGVKPKFIKTGVNGFPLEDIDRKLIEAAAITSRETGLTIASHTNGGGKAAEAQLEIVTKNKVAAGKLVWVHAQSEKDHAFHERMAKAGAWVEFDGINEKSAAWHLECVRHMASKGLLGRTLVSQDSGWYHVGEPGGGTYRGYTYIYTDFLPRLAAAEVKALMADNPVQAFGR